MATELSKLLRFADLRARGIVGNWTNLRRMVERQGFPAGFYLGPCTRVWLEHEVEAWVDERRAASERARAAAEQRVRATA